MPKDKKRKLPYQIDKYHVHTFHYYSPPNIKSKDLYNFNESNSTPSPFKFLTSTSSPPPPPSSPIQLLNSSILSNSATFSPEQSMYLLNSFEKTINSLDKESFKKQKVENDKMFQELNSNRLEMNSSFNNFQQLNNNLFDGSGKLIINENGNNNNNNSNSNNNISNNSDNSYNSNNFNSSKIRIEDLDQSEYGSEDLLISFIDEEDNDDDDDSSSNLNSFNVSTTTPLDFEIPNASPLLTSVSPSANSVSTLTSPFSSTTMISPKPSANFQLSNSCQFLYDGDIFDIFDYKSNQQ